MLQGEYSGDNATGADNQQERLIRLGWVIGFVDGEGCFSIGLIRQPDRVGRKDYKTGYQVNHEFVVTQGAKSIEALREIRDFFGVGRILENKRYDNHKEHLFRLVVCKRSDLLETIIPFFRQHPLRTAKQHDFEKFALCTEMINQNHHKTRDGLADILEIMQTMNRQVPRTDLIRILRDYTPDVQDIE